MTAEPTQRERVRGAVCDEVARRAWELFAVQGFEATTVDEIAEAAGMSRRTFFRYFAGKDHLVLERLVEHGDLIAGLLAARPLEEAAWDALHAALREVAALQEEHGPRSRPLQLMLRDEPALRATLEERRRRWLDLLAPLVALRLSALDPHPGSEPGAQPGAQPDPRPRAVTGAALACLESAQELWADHPGLSLPALLDQAMAAVEPLS